MGVAVHYPSSGSSLANSPFHASSVLLGEFLQVEGIHGALEADVQLVDLALGESKEPNTCEGELLVEAGNVLLIAAQTIKAFGKDDIERARAAVLQ